MGQTVFVIDDDEAVRDAVLLTLDTLAIKARGFEHAQAFLDAWTPELRGVLVLDIRMPGITGLELQEKLRDLGSKLPIIFITGHGDIPMAVQAMRAGATDFLRKPFSDSELVERLQDALRQEAAAAEDREARADVRDRIDSLTARERQVFDRIAEGQANKVVAIELGISERTVEIHRAQVMRKLEARNLAQLVRLKIEAEQSD